MVNHAYIVHAYFSLIMLIILCMLIVVVTLSLCYLIYSERYYVGVFMSFPHYLCSSNNIVFFLDWYVSSMKLILTHTHDQVDLRILKGTVLDHGDDVKGAVRFIVTEVLEEPFNEHMTDAPVSEPVKDLTDTNLTESHVEEQNGGSADDKLIQMTEVTVDTIDLDLFGLHAKFLDNISFKKRQGPHYSFRDEYEGTTFEPEAESPSSTKGILIANMTGIESGT